LDFTGSFSQEWKNLWRERVTTDIWPRLATNIIYTTVEVSFQLIHNKILVFTCLVTSFYIRNQDRSTTDS